MKIDRQSALRRLAVAPVAAVITAATFGAINAAVLLPTSDVAVLNPTTVMLRGDHRPQSDAGVYRRT